MVLYAKINHDMTVANRVQLVTLKMKHEDTNLIISCYIIIMVHLLLRHSMDFVPTTQQPQDLD